VELPILTKGWDYWHTPPHLDFDYLFKKKGPEDSRNQICSYCFSEKKGSVAGNAVDEPHYMDHSTLQNIENASELLRRHIPIIPALWRLRLRGSLV
jgi:hypothetical protein